MMQWLTRILKALKLVPAKPKKKAKGPAVAKKGSEFRRLQAVCALTAVQHEIRPSKLR